MALRRDAGEAGLWVNDDVKPGDPGVYALLIGISRYDHLAEGAEAAGETYGLGQLAVSALTALRFFGWLRSDYVLEGWPLARVRLLLSPLKKGVGKSPADELENCDPNIVTHAPEATFANCKSAIANWYGEMKELKPPSKGRSLLFFSGHGVQIAKANQLLLPSDYARPRGSLDEAIRTQNLFECLSSLAAVPSHVVLLDACRNDIDRLRRVVGTNLIDESGSSGDPLLELRVLRATAYGLRAFQPKTQGGMSLFGQALLDGLSAKPNPILGEAPIELSPRGKVKAVEIEKLQVYMNGRIDALIKSANESVIQIVRSDDSQSAAGRVELTELEQVAAADSTPSKPIKQIEEVTIGTRLPQIEEVTIGTRLPEVYISRDKMLEARKSLPRIGASAQKPKEQTARPGDWFKQRYSRPQRPPRAFGNQAGSAQYAKRLHHLFGSEAFTDPWLKTLRVTGLSTHRSFGHEAIQLVSVAKSEQASELHRLQVHFRVTSEAFDPIGHALMITDYPGRRFCTILPQDPLLGQALYFQVEIDRIGGDFIRFAAYLSSREQGPARLAAAAWDTFRAVGASDAAKLISKARVLAQMEEISRRGKEALAEKFASPVGATAGAVLLLKANRLDLMHDWTRNLANWFPWLPDGVVFWTEQCHREGHGSFRDDVIPWFVRELSARSLPFTCDGLGLAANLLSDIERERIAADPLTRSAAAHVKERVDAAMFYFRDDGLFCTYAGMPEDWVPAAVLGPPAVPAGSPPSNETTSAPDQRDLTR